MTEKELKIAEELQAQINGALVTLHALPVSSWGPLIDTETRLTQADNYLTQFIALCEKRMAGVQ